MAWVRLDDAILDDEWLQSCSVDERYVWIALLVYSAKDRGCIKSKSPIILANRVWSDKDTVSHFIQKALSAGKIEETDDGYIFVNFSKYNADPKNAERQARFRARSRGAFVEDIDREEVYNSAGGLCAHCGKPVRLIDMQIDHIIPLSKGGQHERANVCCSCKECNMRKSNKLINSGVTGVTSVTLPLRSNATKGNPKERKSKGKPISLVREKAQPILDWWDKEVCAEIPELLPTPDISDTLLRHIACRMDEPSFDLIKLKAGLTNWKWCRGYNDSTWKATLLWLVQKKDNVIKVLGYADNRKSDSPDTSQYEALVQNQ